MRTVILFITIIFFLPFYVLAGPDECNTGKVYDMIAGDLARAGVGAPTIVVKTISDQNNVLACRVDGAYEAGMPIHGVALLKNRHWPTWRWDRD